MNCHTDRDCPQRKKCCNGFCQRECRPQDICHLPSDTGPCRALIRRWFYDKHSGRCREFIYGGCQGNANNFEDVEECERRCGPPDNKPGTCPIVVQGEEVVCGKVCSSDASCPGPQRCCPTSCGKKCEIPQQHLPGYCPLLILPPRRGDVCFPNCTSDWDCNRMVNLPLKKCCSFAGRQICVHGVEEHPGVCPRRVELQTLLPCNNTCRDDLDCSLTEKCCFTGCGRGCLPSLRSEVCQLPLEQGSCKQQLQRYFYDPDKKKCVSYRVCEASRRNFETRELCEKACGKISKEVCKLPKDAGRCRGYSPQYYFNWETKRCEIFVYGLCGSNDNRFSSKLECQMVCGEFEQQQQQQQQQQKQRPKE
ncbi:WAP four-disulfide core domain protein 8-like [Crotalus tigris]|uniref:WAP four-disulfide core domain protein 8-like n=1 Tax=Crotalus tigris TaxID=88082 RepID=UPI00192F8319|nr:WAP four-disulfide core domain protein 8-like [Crotalus tigris]